ncbi:unnamed protein product [Paramecium primaurelia]|uniref:Uncharacterized protein n=1 Tax=Paramecium primaurelia TaxID=5886 RepID=A0A8S1QQ68_PARPR|nr:unnamed protein product [Paramecium primaurelia]
MEKKFQINDQEGYKKGHQEGDEERYQEGDDEKGHEEGDEEGHLQVDEEVNQEEYEEGHEEGNYSKSKEKEMNEEKTSILMNFENLQDKNGKVNEFYQMIKKQYYQLMGQLDQVKVRRLRQKNLLMKKSVMKSQYLFIFHNLLQKILCFKEFQEVEETLHQYEYDFDELQQKQCKEMLKKKEFDDILEKRINQNKSSFQNLIRHKQRNIQ